MLEEEDEYDITDMMDDDYDDDDAYDSRTRPMTQEELKRLREAHGGDPFPMTSTLQEEMDSWVPREAALKGLSFFAARLPNTPHRWP